MDETNSTIEPEIAKELSAAVTEVVDPKPEAPARGDGDGEGKPHAEPAGKDAETAPEPKAEKFKADNELTERAIRAGLTLEDVKSFSSKEQADRMLALLEAKSEVKPKDEEANGEANGDGEGFPAIKEFEETLKAMEDDGDYAPEFLKMFKGMTAMLKQQLETIASLKKAGATAEAASFFDEQVNGLGADVAKHLDAASRSKLEAKFKMLERAYADDSSMKREDIFREAATLAIGDILAKAESEGKAAKLKERRNLALARPGGEQGNNGKPVQLTTEEGVANAVFEMLTK